MPYNYFNPHKKTSRRAGGSKYLPYFKSLRMYTDMFITILLL